ITQQFFNIPKSLQNINEEIINENFSCNIKEQILQSIEDINIKQEDFQQNLKQQYESKDDQYLHYSYMFHLLNNHFDGLNKYDIMAFLSNLGEDIEEQELEEIIQYYDKDNNGRLNYQEFMQMICHENMQTNQDNDI
ncbi:hypothetical protein IMG5_134920, partial [Ichthyophthirius multifiliis]